MKKNIVIWGYGYEGLYASELFFSDDRYDFLGFADNNIYLQGFFTYGFPIRNMEQLKELDRKTGGVSVVIASNSYIEIIKQCVENEIDIEGVFLNRVVVKYSELARFENLSSKNRVVLFAGDIGDDVNIHNDCLYGLSISKWDKKHIYHDITKKYPLPDDSVDLYISENVFEFIDPQKYTETINEIYRVLKPGCSLRISMPDYNSPFMKRRAMTDENGKVLYDARENVMIKYGKNGLKGGMLFFSTYEKLKPILNNTEFSKFHWMRYFLEDGRQVRKDIDLDKGYLWRNDPKYNLEDYNIVVDCIK